ncbi:MAG: heme exporter protein CcmD [Kiloniellaceae bacterium]
MEQIQTFLAMGGYGAFVWPAFGLTALVMVWLLAATLRGLRARERALKELQVAAPAARPRGNRDAAP